MTNKKQKNQQAEPFEVNYERMTNPVKKLLAGIRKEDLNSLIEEDIAPEQTFASLTQSEAQVDTTQVNTTRVEPTQVKSTQVDTTRVESTQVKPTQVIASKVEIEANFTKVDNDILDKAIMALTASEFIAYLKLYRLSYGFKNNTCRIGRGRLSKICNLKSDKTVQVALTGLEEKGYIKAVEGKETNPRGTLYRIYLPQEVNNIQSSTRVKFTQVENAQVDTTQVKSTQVDATRVENNNYLSKNYLSKNSQSFKERDHEVKEINHHQTEHEESVMMIYQQATGNNWAKADIESYEKIKNIPLESIEMAIKLATQRAATRPNSLAYFVKEITNIANPPKQNRNQRKKAMEKIIERVRNSFVGGSYSASDFVYKVKDLCLKEDIAFENDLFDEIFNKKK
jgi:hypothetical protein